MNLPTHVHVYVYYKVMYYCKQKVHCMYRYRDIIFVLYMYNVHKFLLEQLSISVP